MNLNDFKDRVHSRIQAQMDGCITILTQNNVRPADIRETEKGVVVMPAKTASEIAMETIHANSMIRAYAMAHDILQQEFDKLMKPQQPQEAAPAEDDGSTDDPNHEGGIYGP